jgi:hypothetical protein
MPPAPPATASVLLLLLVLVLSARDRPPSIKALMIRDCQCVVVQQCPILTAGSAAGFPPRRLMPAAAAAAVGAAVGAAAVRHALPAHIGRLDEHMRRAEVGSWVGAGAGAWVGGWVPAA